MKKSKKKTIINKIREVPQNDFKAPKNAKFKIVFYKPPPKENTNIPKKFQGLQYYETKKNAEDALNERMNLSKKLREKKSSSMMNNKLAIGNSGNIYSLIKIQNERTKFYKYKVLKGIEFLKKGYNIMEAQKIIIDTLKLNIDADSRTLLPWMAEARDKVSK